MSDFWNYLTAPENRDTLTWLGGGLTVICGGIWTVIRFFVGRGKGGDNAANAPNPPRPERSDVLADHGGIAAGGNVNIETRTGMPPGHLILLVLAILGAMLVAVTQVGNRVSVTNGIGIGGDVEGSTITN